MNPTSFADKWQDFIAVCVFNSVVFQNRTESLLLPITENPRPPVNIVIELKLGDKFAEISLPVLGVSGPSQTPTNSLVKVNKTTITDIAMHNNN